MKNTYKNGVNEKLVLWDLLIDERLGEQLGEAT